VDKISEFAIQSVSFLLPPSECHLPTLQVILHCLYTVSNDTFWGENDTVQPFTAVTPLAWHYRLLNVNRLTVKCALQWRKYNRFLSSPLRQIYCVPVTKTFYRNVIIRSSAT